MSRFDSKSDTNCHERVPREFKGPFSKDSLKVQRQKESQEKWRKNQLYLIKDIISQLNGKCYGDALMLLSPQNDTISLCGKRDGLALKLAGYQDYFSLDFKSLDKSSGPGFTCRLKVDKPEVILIKDEKVEPFTGE